jgi:hypothetical protein
MASRIRFSQVSRLLSALILALVLCSAFVLPVSAKNTAGAFPSLNSFVESVSNGDANTLRGVYVQDLMAFPIIQQPVDAPGFVSQNNGQLTQFNMAAQAGNVGLLAHNYLAGNSFSGLKSGDVVILVFGDGRTESFSVTGVFQYQALDPNNMHSDFKDLQTQATMSAGQLFDKVYRGERHVTFQTCIEGDGNLSWGRLFVIAEPTTNDTVAPEYTYAQSAYEWLWGKK